MATVYCGSCGAALSDTAKFCRSCGGSQDTTATAPQPLPPAPSPSPAPPLPPVSPGFAAPPPPPGPPPPGPGPARVSDAASVGAVLALVGGTGICLLALYSLLFLPLKHGFSYTYDQPPRLCDVLTLLSGLLAVGLGARSLRRAAAGSPGVGVLLLALSLPALALTVVTLYPDNFQIDFFQRPFYVDFNYFAFVLNAQVDGHYLPVPLLASLVAIVLGGLTMAAAPRRPAATPGWQ